MPEMTTYEHGVPSWVDIGLPDLAAGVAYYKELLRWSAVDDLGEEAGHYSMANVDGKLVAGLGPAQQPGPPYWTTYVNVDDLAAIVDKVASAGGTVIVEPMDVMSAGKMAIFADTTGAVFAAWQAGEHPGAGLVNEPGTFVWSELSTSDLSASKAFYGAVFGWGWGGADEYAEAQVGGRSIGGAMPRPEGMPAETPDHWLVYFATADVDADAGRAAELGGTVVAGPMDVPTGGRFCVVIDPQGAAFGLYQGAMG